VGPSKVGQDLDRGDRSTLRGGQPTGKAVQAHLRGRELESHAGHRARKGTLIAPRVKPVALRKPAPAPAA